MSIIYAIDDIDLQKREATLKDLTLYEKFEDDKKSRKAYPEALDLYEIIGDDHVAVPLNYALTKIGSVEKEYPPADFEFTGKLLPRQENIKEQALDLLTEDKSVLLALRTAFGKCLDPETNVKLWGGDNIKAKNIKKGYKLIGDDSKPRTVISVCKGHDMMFGVYQEIGDDYIVNSSHILSLLAHHGTVPKELISKSDDHFDYVDIEIKDYFILDQGARNLLFGYKVGVEYSERETPTDPYFLGLWLIASISEDGYTKFLNPFNKKINDIFNSFLGDVFIPEESMIYQIPYQYLFNSSNVRMELLAGIIDGCADGKTSGLFNNEYHVELNKYPCQYKRFFGKQFEDLISSLGFIYSTEKGIIMFSGRNVDRIPSRIFNAKRISTLRSSTSDKINLNIPIYYRIRVEALRHGTYCGFVIDGNHRFLLGDYTVTHNTIFTSYLSSEKKLKTMVLAHRDVLIDQWRQAYEKFTTAKVQIVKPAKPLDPEADVYIMNVISVTKKAREEYNDIGFLVYDEAHATMCTPVTSKSIFWFQPKYVVALTATPERSDGMHQIISKTIGEGVIIRKMFTMFNVYIVYTNIYSDFKPKIESNSQGGLDWNKVLESQAVHENRNQLIVDLVRYFATRTILILCKRKDQCEILAKKLKKLGVDVDTYYGSTKYLNYDCRVLICTYSKGGVGMDCPKLDMLLVASDVEENFTQFAGRVFRRDEIMPIIIDLVDSFKPLQNHASTRFRICKECGGTVKRFDRYFPEFVLWRKTFG